MGFTDLEEYDRVNRRALWKVQRMYDTDRKVLNGSNCIHVNSLACVRVNRREGGLCFRIDNV